jgi:hypothetical protein
MIIKKWEGDLETLIVAKNKNCNSSSLERRDRSVSTHWVSGRYKDKGISDDLAENPRPFPWKMADKGFS